MGGHGGLNILPQKSWNGMERHKQLSISPPGIILKLGCHPAVYGRENRLKVSRDEAKFEEENKLKRERHLQVANSKAPHCPMTVHRATSAF